MLKKRVIFSDKSDYLACLGDGVRAVGLQIKRMLPVLCYSGSQDELGRDIYQLTACSTQ